MSLIKCPECNHEVSTEAELCPNCGYPIKEKQKVKDNNVILENEPIFLVDHRKKNNEWIKKYLKRKYYYGFGMIIIGLILMIVSIIMYVTGLNSNIYNDFYFLFASFLLPFGFILALCSLFPFLCIKTIYKNIDGYLVLVYQNLLNIKVIVDGKIKRKSTNNFIDFKLPNGRPVEVVIERFSTYIRY